MRKVWLTKCENDTRVKVPHNFMSVRLTVIMISSYDQKRSDNLSMISYFGLWNISKYVYVDCRKNYHHICRKCSVAEFFRRSCHAKTLCSSFFPFSLTHVIILLDYFFHYFFQVLSICWWPNQIHFTEISSLTIILWSYHICHCLCLCIHDVSYQKKKCLLSSSRLWIFKWEERMDSSLHWNSMGIFYFILVLQHNRDY
jgi:hypothetical protein